MRNDPHTPADGNETPPTATQGFEVSDAGKEYEEGLSGHSHMTPIWNRLVDVLAAFMAAFYLYTALVGANRLEVHLGVYVGLTYVMIFLVYPLRRGSEKRKPSILDFVLAGLSAAAVVYWVTNYRDLTYRAGAYTDLDNAMSVLMVLLSLEIGRRALGWVMPIVGLVLMVYAYFGPYMPLIIAHRGYGIERIAGAVFLDERGLWGTMADVLVNYVILFIFFGAFLNRSGVGQFFIDLAVGIAGRATGGPPRYPALPPPSWAPSVAPPSPIPSPPAR